MIRHDLNLDYIDFYCGQCECDLRHSFNNEGQPYFQTAKELLVNNDESVKNFVCHKCFIHCTNDAAKNDENYKFWLAFNRFIDEADKRSKICFTAFEIAEYKKLGYKIKPDNND